jgi:hypothetical protein
MNIKPIATFGAVLCSAALLMAPALAQAATAKKGSTATKSKVKAKSSKASKAAASEKLALASPRPSAGAMVPGAGQSGLNAADLAVAERVHVGHLPCELGASVTLTADPVTPGYFNLQGKNFSYRMFPVQTTTGAVRLEDPGRARYGCNWPRNPC